MESEPSRTETSRNALMAFCEARTELWAHYTAAMGEVVEAVAKMQNHCRGNQAIALSTAMEDAIAARQSALEWRRIATLHEREHGCGPCRG